MNKKFVDAIIISKALEWISDGSFLPAQHYISLHYQNMRPILLSCPLEQPDICVEPLIKKIKHWRESGLLIGILRPIMKIWDILLLQTLFIRFSVVKGLILCLPNPSLKICSY